MHAPIRDAKSSDFAILDDIDAARIGAARIAPGDRVMSGDAAAPLQGRAINRVTGLRRIIEDRAVGLELLQIQQLGIDAIEVQCIDPPRQPTHLMGRMREVEQAALAEHDVEVQLLAQALPQLQRVLVKMRALVPEIIGAHDGGVAAGVAAADPALLQHGDIGDAVLLGEVVSRRQAVAAAADDDDVILRLWLRAAPGFLPVLMVAESIPGEGEDRIARLVRHGGSRMLGARHPGLGCRGKATAFTSPAPWPPFVQGGGEAEPGEGSK
jgi:hypothetical protein